MKFEFAQSRCSECQKSRRYGPIMLSTSEYTPLCSPLFYCVSFSFSFSFFSSIPPRSNCGMPQKVSLPFFSVISPIIYLDKKSWFNRKWVPPPRSFPMLVTARIGLLIQQIGNVMHLEVGTVLVGSLESQAAHLLKVPKTLRVSGTFSMGLALRLP